MMGYLAIAENAPLKSKLEMEAISKLEKGQTFRLLGTLGMHEEYPGAGGEAIQKFL